MSTRMPSCDWVRMRLPLEIGPDQADFGEGPGNEDADLDAKDRAKLARHLADCPACRRHRAELLDAMTALSAVSAIVPIERDAPSLWPALEHRIREREELRKRPARRAVSLGRWVESIPAAMRIHLARAWDAVLESIDVPLDRYRDFLPERGFRLRPGIAFGALLAALLGGVIALQADRARSRIQLEIAQGSRPIFPSAPSSSVSATDGDSDQSEIDVAAEDGGNRWLWHSSSRTFITSSDDDGGEEPARSTSGGGLPGPLAQAEISPHGRSLSAASGGSPGAGSGAGATSASSAPSKYDFDLERGTPMTPDTRDAKPAY